MRPLALTAILVSMLAGCDQPSTISDAGRDASVRDSGAEDAGRMDAGRDGGLGEDAGSDSGTMADAGGPCPPIGARTVVHVPEGVLADAMTTWTCDNLYVLDGIVLVHSSTPATPQLLTIEPGVVVHGATDAAARGFLVITRNGRIHAQGTAELPIVLTSANAVGSRARDDWGGVTLLGRAFVGGARRTEGFPVGTTAISDLDPFLAYGPEGSDPADDAWSCGSMRYVRIEFASFNAGGGGGNESNALQLYSCGRETEIDFVQTHLSGDDGIEIFGGTVDLRHLVLTGASDDLFDWDDGWRGRAQFVVGQQHTDVADFGIEAGGGSDTPSFPPDPRIFNVTLVGGNGAAGQIGARLRGASRGYFRNFVFLGFTDGVLDIGGTVAVTNLTIDPIVLSMQHSVFGQGSAPVAWPTGGDDAADGSFIEQDFFTMAAQNNQVTDPMLTAPFDLDAPDWTPAAGAPLGASEAEAPSEADGDTRPAFFDTTAVYVGAFAPGGADWTAGWTAYPAN